jgi:hypothetical protein
VNNKVEWFFRFVRMAGASNPVSAIFLQIQSEVDAIEVNKRLDSLEDPIISMHDLSYELCKCLYQGMLDGGGFDLNLEDDFYSNYSRPLAIFEAKGYVKRIMGVGCQHVTVVELTDPSFIVYLGRKFADQISIAELYDLVENCQVGEHIDGIQLGNALNVPFLIVRALFQVCQNNGIGLLSNETGTCSYRGIA